MEIGDQEWFRKVEAAGAFPSDYAFYVDTDKDISATCLNSNVRDIGKIKYKRISDWSDKALIEVSNCKTSTDYYETIKKLIERWG